MTENSITSEVEVAVDPDTAFRCFTEELNCWWIQGPINFHDSSRAYDMRMEPKLGGKIVEVYDDTKCEGLTLAEITEWQPGKRLAWKSLIDDVTIVVAFTAIGSGTKVSVVATLTADGRDEGGTAWVRMTPVWFGAWISKRESAVKKPIQLSRLAVAVNYEQPARAARWLRDVFQFEPSSDIPDEEPPADHTWIEFHIGNAPLVLFGEARSGDSERRTHTPWVFVDDLDAHYAHVKDAGGTIIEEIWQHGPRAYKAEDLEGHHWTFAQASPRM